jgi:hypothetical protein
LPLLDKQESFVRFFAYLLWIFLLVGFFWAAHHVSVDLQKKRK